MFPAIRRPLADEAVEPVLCLSPERGRADHAEIEFEVIERRHVAPGRATGFADQSQIQPACIRPVGDDEARRFGVYGRVNVLADGKAVFACGVGNAEIGEERQWLQRDGNGIVGPQQREVQALRVMLVGGRDDEPIVFFVEDENEALSLVFGAGRTNQPQQCHQDDRQAAAAHLRCSSLNNLYSTESTSASQLASMMLSSTPTVPHVSVPWVLSMMTRVLAAVPAVVTRVIIESTDGTDTWGTVG